MGKYSGYLLLSDIDGTFTHDGKISQKNIRAVEEFTRQGGIFTLATGRLPDFLEDMGFYCPYPAVSVDGTLIYDSKAKKVLWKMPLKESSLKTVYEAFPLASELDHVRVYYMDQCLMLKTEKEFKEALFAGPEVFKTVYCFKDSDRALRFKSKFLEKYGEVLQVERSWYTGVDIHEKNTGKARCIEEYKKLFPQIHTVCAVGDFENDTDMLRAADIGYAVENALDEVKAAADRIAPDCAHDAIAYVIEDMLR